MARGRKSVPVTARGSSMCTVDSHLQATVHCELLAYLEYTISEYFSTTSGCFPPNSFLKAAAKYLGDTLGRKSSVSIVREKLQYIWGRFGPSNAKESDYRRLFTQGIQALPRLDGNFKEEVRKRAEDIRDSLKGAKAPRQLRSASRTPKSVVKNSGNPRWESPQHRRRRTRPGQVRGNSRWATPSRTGGSIVSPSPRIHHALLGSTTPTKVKTERVTIEIPNSRESAAEVEACPRQLDQEDPKPDSIASSDDDIGISETEASNSPISLGFRPREPTLDTEVDRFDDPELYLERVKKQKNAEIEYWRTRCTGAENQCTELKIKNDHLQADILNRFVDVSPRSDLKLLLRIDRLQKQLNSLRAVQWYSKSDPGNFPPIDTKSVLQDMKTIQARLRDILPAQDTAFVFERARLARHGDLCALFQRGFRLDIQQAVDPAKVDALFSGTRTRSVLRCLLSAALCEWVFDADARPLFQEPNLLYSKIRDLLADLSPDFARATEYSAHRAVLDDPSMHDSVIPTRARLLARRVLQSFLPLVKGQIPPKSGSSSMVTDWLGEEARLTDVFKLALQIQTRLLISTDLYRCKFDPPGAQVRSYSMEFEGEDGPAAWSPGPGSTIKFTLVHGLQRCATDDRDFTYKHFVQEAQAKDEMAWEPLSNAVVLLR